MTPHFVISLLIACSPPSAREQTCELIVEQIDTDCPATAVFTIDMQFTWTAQCRDSWCSWDDLQQVLDYQRCAQAACDRGETHPAAGCGRPACAPLDPYLVDDSGGPHTGP